MGSLPVKCSSNATSSSSPTHENNDDQCQDVLYESKHTLLLSSRKNNSVIKFIKSQALYEKEKLLLVTMPPHPQLISLFAFDDLTQSLLFPRASCDLFQWLHSRTYANGLWKSSLSLTPFLYLIQDLMLGYEFLLQHSIEHYDLKPENLLLFSYPRFHLRIADFGLAEKGAYSYALSRGTSGYMAPELSPECYVQNPYLPHSMDLFSMGMILTYVLLLPFSDYNRENKPWTKDQYREFLEDVEWILPQRTDLTEWLRTWIQNSLRFLPAARSPIQMMVTTFSPPLA